MFLALCDACSGGNNAVARWLLDEWKSPRIKYISSFLSCTSANGNLNAVKRLSQQYIEEHNVSGDSVKDLSFCFSQALRVACYQGRSIIAKWLAENTPVDLNSCGVVDYTEDLLTPLVIASCRECLDISKYLVKRITPHTVNKQVSILYDSAINCVIDQEPGGLPVHTCIERGLVDFLHMLLFNCDVNKQDNRGDTPLHFACIQGNTEITQVLLSIFATSDITNRDGHTPSDLVIISGNFGILEFLKPSMKPQKTSSVNHADEIAACIGTCFGHNHLQVVPTPSSDSEAVAVPTTHFCHGTTPAVRSESDDYDRLVKPVMAFHHDRIREYKQKLLIELRNIVSATIVRSPSITHCVTPSNLTDIHL